MKRLLLLLTLGLTVVSCQNKELGEIPLDNTVAVHVRINWQPGQTVPVNDGMRINLFSLSEGVGHYGMEDVDCKGAQVNLKCGTSHRTFAYSFRGNNIYFRNQLDQTLIEAYCAPMSRATYSRAFPNQTTISDAEGNFYVGKHHEYTVLETLDEQFIEVYPENKLYTYTFEVRNVQGAEFIHQTRGAISGMSGSYFLGTGALSTSPSTVLFNATVDVNNSKITGSFRTFGRLGDDNEFTIEVIYPSNTNGIIQKTWNVTSQIDNGTNFHIVIDDSGLVIPDEGGGLNSGWTVILDDWNEETIQLQ
ncbi:DUF5119 domain-containing protein [Alistipes sp. OttesenSCG-928-B03]|nr:DUF5119 domain-containing protein [Alistipes sp. OttesenSCG-928-B03]